MDHLCMFIVFSIMMTAYCMLTVGKVGACNYWVWICAPFRQCGIQSSPDTSAHDHHGESNPRISDLESIFTCPCVPPPRGADLFLVDHSFYIFGSSTT